MPDETSPEKTAPPGGEARSGAKLTVRVGDREVHLEARPEIVRAELDRVLDRLLPPGGGEPATAGGGAGDPATGDDVVVSVTAPRSGQAAASGPPADGAVAAAPRPALDSLIRSRGRDNLQPGAVELLRQVTLDPADFQHLYSVDPGGRVCLLARPHTAEPDDDLLRLLLYGHLTLRGTSRVTGGHLLHGARSLGLKLQRVPRAFGRDDGRVAAVGRHRRRRYGLTAVGVRHCEALIRKLLAARRD